MRSGTLCRSDQVLGDDMIFGRKLSSDDLRRLLEADHLALVTFLGDEDSRRLAHAFRAVKLYRWAQFHYGQGRRGLGRLIWQANLTLTGADISPISDFGPGLVVPCPLGVTLFGVAGNNLTVHGQAVLGGGVSRRDIGAGSGRPLLGNDVELGHGAMVLGPVLVGDCAKIGPGCVVMQDVAPHTTLRAPPPIKRAREERHA